MKLNTEVKKNIHRLVISSPTYSCTYYFEDLGDKMKVWNLQINTMEGMGFGRQQSAPKFMPKEEARAEWRKKIASGWYRI